MSCSKKKRETEKKQISIWSFLTQSLTHQAVCQAGLLEETFALLATETTQRGASNCAEGSCLLCEGRFSPGELYRMFFWSRQGKQQQLCTSSWGGMHLCVCACWYSRRVCVCVCSGCGADGAGHTEKLSPGNYIVSFIHKKRREKKTNVWRSEWNQEGQRQKVKKQPEQRVKNIRETTKRKRSGAFLTIPKNWTDNFIFSGSFSSQWGGSGIDRNYKTWPVWRWMMIMFLMHKTNVVSSLI